MQSSSSLLSLLLLLLLSLSLSSSLSSSPLAKGRGPSSSMTMAGVLVASADLRKKLVMATLGRGVLQNWPKHRAIHLKFQDSMLALALLRNIVIEAVTIAETEARPSSKSHCPAGQKQERSVFNEAHEGGQSRECNASLWNAYEVPILRLPKQECGSAFPCSRRSDTADRSAGAFCRFLQTKTGVR
jgi:hypothetical protein